MNWEIFFLGNTSGIALSVIVYISLKWIRGGYSDDDGGR